MGANRQYALTDQQLDQRFRDLSWGTMVALQGKPHIYAGTVPPVEVRRRRGKNRDARRARRGNTRALTRQARLNRDHTPRFRRGHAPYIPGISQPVDAEIIEAGS